MEQKKRGKKPGAVKTGGRVKGTPNKLTADMREMIRAALDGVGGIAYLIEQARENPTAFLTLVGKIVPSVTTLSGDPDAPIYQKTIIELVSPKNPDA